MKMRHKYRASEIFQNATGAKQPKISPKIVAGSKCFNCNYCEALDKRFWREELMVLENDRPRRQNVPRVNAKECLALTFKDWLCIVFIRVRGESGVW